jgi:hypothetical protein
LVIRSKNWMELYKTPQSLAPLFMPLHHFTKRLGEARVAFHAFYRIGSEPRRMLLELGGNYVFA